MNNNNLEHWYDGWFYDKFIAPNQDTAYKVLESIIENSSTILDAGCGTGRLANKIQSKILTYDGVDASAKNISTAQKIFDGSVSDRISFHHSDVQTFLKSKNKVYDYAIMSYVIHEVDEGKRVEILKVLSESANQIILVDYLYPRSKNFWSLLNEVVEFAAGREHYRNFKTYLKGNGIKGLAEKAHLKIAKEIKNIPQTSHIVVLRK